MRDRHPLPAASERSPKPTPNAEKRLAMIADVKKYVRRELGLSRRDADKVTRYVHTDADLARAVLPERWAEELHPPARHLHAVERATDAGNVGADLTACMGPEEHDAYQTVTRGRRRAAALAFARQAVAA